MNTHDRILVALPAPADTGVRISDWPYWMKHKVDDVQVPHIETALVVLRGLGLVTNRSGYWKRNFAGEMRARALHGEERES